MKPEQAVITSSLLKHNPLLLSLYFRQGYFPEGTQYGSGMSQLSLDLGVKKTQVEHNRDQDKRVVV